MSPASKATAAKKVPASRPPAAKKAAPTKKSAPQRPPRRPRTATPTKKTPPTKKAVPTKNAQAAKKPAPTAKSGGAVKKESTMTKKAAPAAKKAAGPAKKTAPATKAAASAVARLPQRRSTRAPEAEAAPPAPARTTFTPKPKPPAPVRPKTGPYAKDLKFLEEISELLAEERAIYQEQATSLRAEADSLALEREPGDVQFDEESGEGGTVTVDRERNLALSGQAALAVEEIDYASRAGGRQDLRVLRAMLPAHPQAPPAGASLRQALRGLQERGAVAPLIPRGSARARALAFALAVVVVVADRVTTTVVEHHLHGAVHRLGAVRIGPAVQLRAWPSACSPAGPRWSRCCSRSASWSWPSSWPVSAPCPRPSAGDWSSAEESGT